MGFLLKQGVIDHNLQYHISDLNAEKSQPSVYAFVIVLHVCYHCIAFYLVYRAVLKTSFLSRAVFPLNYITLFITFYDYTNIEHGEILLTRVISGSQMSVTRRRARRKTVTRLIRIDEDES